MRPLLVRIAHALGILVAALGLVALALTAPASAVGPPEYYGPHLVYRTSDGHVHVLTATRSWIRWAGYGPDVDQDATASARTSWLAVGTPWGWVTSTQEHIVYRSSNGHVHELWRAIGTGRWQHTDLTAAAGTTARAAGDVTGWDDSMRHVLYRGTDGRLHAFRWDNAAARWRDIDVSAATHVTTTVASDPRYDPMSGMFTYRTSDGRIHLVTWSGSRATDKDLSSAARAGVAAAGRPTVLFGENTVLYRGTDRHLHALVPNGAGGWVQQDLTRLAGGPANVVGDPMGWRWTYSYLNTYVEVRYLDAAGTVNAVTRDLGSNDPDRGGYVPPSPWGWWTDDYYTGYRSLSPVTFGSEMSPTFGNVTVDGKGHLQLWAYDEPTWTSYPVDVTESAGAPPAATGGMAYFTEFGYEG